MEPYHIPKDKVAVHEVVGGGALGSVYRGVYEGREVALKCIHLLRDDAQAVRAMGGALSPDERRHVLATFKRECDLLRQLQHENILPFIGVVVDAAQQPLYLAATFVGSGNLHDLIHRDSGLGLRTGKDGTLPLSVQTKVAVGVFSALAYLASVPAIHRDVKPANILTVLSRSGLERIYLADFGEAQQLTRNMAVGHGAGTPDYMAPEMRSMESIRCPKADVFSAGIVLVEMSSGKQPNPGSQWRDDARTALVPEDERRRDDLRAMHGSDDLAMIVQQCIVDRPTDRADAASILSQLEAMQPPSAAGGGSGDGRRGGGRRHRHTRPEERPLRSCPAGHSLQPLTASSHNCDICGEHVFPGRTIFGCRDCNYDTCDRCYATLAGRAVDSPVKPPSSGEVVEQLARLRVSENLTGSNAVVDVRVTRSGSGVHHGAGTLLGWKVDGVRYHDTSGGLTSDNYCRISFDNGGSWNVPMSEVTIIGSSSPTTAGSGSGSSGCRAGAHRFVNRQCMVCKGCGCCTGFGRACLLHQDGRTGGEQCGCGGGDSGCADCGLCKSCVGQESPTPSRSERSKFTVHVGDGSYSVESTATSLAEFKSEANMRSLRRDFAKKLGIPVRELPEIQVDESTAEINPRARGLASVNKAKRIIENHKVEWLRVAQLAVPEVAQATGPRFCDGGPDAEKAVVCEGLLNVLEAGGWKLQQGCHRIWAGNRDMAQIAIAGEDADDKEILAHILSQIVESLEDLRSDPAHKDRLSHLEQAAARALAAEDRTWRCAARLATQGDPASSESSHFLAWVMETVEPRGLMVAEGLGKILGGDRNADSVTLGADLCDSACLRKVLEYITAIEAGTEFADGWPTMKTLAGPNDNTSRFIEANQQAFEWLATADDDNGDGSHTKTQLRKVLQKWEQHGWELTRGVELMWDGERTEHVVVEDADSNSKHVLRAILRAFEAFSSPSPPAPASGTSVQREHAATNRHGQKLQQVLAFTGCTEEVALDCLDATSGNVEQASILALDAVGREERKR